MNAHDFESEIARLTAEVEAKQTAWQELRELCDQLGGELEDARGFCERVRSENRRLVEEVAQARSDLSNGSTQLAQATRDLRAKDGQRQAVELRLEAEQNECIRLRSLLRGAQAERDASKKWAVRANNAEKKAASLERKAGELAQRVLRLQAHGEQARRVLRELCRLAGVESEAALETWVRGVGRVLGSFAALAQGSTNVPCIALYPSNPAVCRCLACSGQRNLAALVARDEAARKEIQHLRRGIALYRAIVIPCERPAGLESEIAIRTAADDWEREACGACAEVQHTGVTTAQHTCGAAPQIEVNWPEAKEPQ